MVMGHSALPATVPQPLLLKLLLDSTKVDSVSSKAVSKIRI